MKNVMKPLIDAWFTLLDGRLTYNATAVNVYKQDTGVSDGFHYVLLRAESETDDSNKAMFITKPIVIVDIVTVHGPAIQRSIVDEIDDQIREALFPTRSPALVTIGFQISNVVAQSSTYLTDSDGVKKYYRKVTRFSHRLNQT